MIGSEPSYLGRWEKKRVLARSIRGNRFAVNQSKELRI